MIRSRVDFGEECPIVTVMNWSPPVIIAIVVGLGVVGVGLVLAVRRALRRTPGDSAVVGLIWYFLQVYGPLWQRIRYIDTVRLPDPDDPGSLIVISNHTGGVDPLLIQAHFRFSIRWLMATDSMAPALNWFWRRADVIGVDRTGSDTAAAREAIRHVKEGGVVGIFPEGGIVHPEGEIRPFMEGVGLIVSRTKAPVLLVWVSGARECESPFGSVLRRGRMRIEFVDLITFGEKDRPAEITRRCRQCLAEASGWPVNDTPVPSARREEVDVDVDPFAS